MSAGEEQYNGPEDAWGSINAASCHTNYSDRWHRNRSKAYLWTGPVELWKYSTTILLDNLSYSSVELR